MSTQLQLNLHSHLYIRDPQNSALGIKIISESISLIHEIGFEAFTFKKLSQKIHSAEASIYRYFENKHRLLTYLIAWYWSYLEFRITYETHNISDPKEKLRIALRCITERLQDDPQFANISESVLQQVVIIESDKTYLTKTVDSYNEAGLFRGYKSLCVTIATYVKEINPDFAYPHSLVSTCLEAVHHQIFFAEHLPTLSDVEKGDQLFENTFDFISTLIFKTIS